LPIVGVAGEDSSKAYQAWQGCFRSAASCRDRILHPVKVAEADVSQLRLDQEFGRGHRDGQRRLSFEHDLDVADQDLERDLGPSPGSGSPRPDEIAGSCPSTSSTPM